MNLLTKVWKAIDTVNKELNPLVVKVKTLDTDLYSDIKETSQLKYRMVELELRLSNLEAMVKIQTEKGGQ